MASWNFYLIPSQIFFLPNFRTHRCQEWAQMSPLGHKPALGQSVNWLLQSPFATTTGGPVSLSPAPLLVYFPQKSKLLPGTMSKEFPWTTHFQPCLSLSLSEESGTSNSKFFWGTLLWTRFFLSSSSANTQTFSALLGLCPHIPPSPSQKLTRTFHSSQICLTWELSFLWLSCC